MNIVPDIIVSLLCVEVVLVTRDCTQYLLLIEKQLPPAFSKYTHDSIKMRKKLFVLFSG